MTSQNTEAGSSQPLYQTLDKSQREIRLIEIVSKSPDDKVECRLHTALLTPETYYVCLSYVWGDPSILEEIIVDGVPRQVTVNLATALRHLKKHWIEVELESDPDLDTSKFRLWADALCINQKDDAERTHQVKLMADIYSSAEMVLAWLSSNDEDVAGGFDLFERIFQELRSCRDALFVKFGFTDDQIHFNIVTGVVELQGLLPEDSGLFDNQSEDLRPGEPCAILDGFCALPFWTRVWIQQEIALAIRLYYVSPTHRLSIERCSKAIRACISSLLFLEHQRHHLGRPVQLVKVQRLISKHPQILSIHGARTYALGKKGFCVKDDKLARISPIMEEFSRMFWHGSCIKMCFHGNLKATHPLDYVYGLLAVTEAPIIPDYTKTIREVNIECMQWAVALWKDIARSPVTTNLCNATIYQNLLSIFAVGVRRLHGLPSWAPVFPESERRRPLVMEVDMGTCAFRTVSKLSSRPPMVISGTSLWAKAIKVQVVKTVHGELVSHDFMCKSLISFVEDLLQLDDPHRPDILNGMPLLLALYATLLLKMKPLPNAKRLVHWLLISRQLPESFKTILSDEQLAPLSDQSYIDSVTSEWEQASKRYAGNRLFITEDRYIGSMPDGVLPGDVVCVLTGCSQLVVLRPEENHYLFVGCCYMAGLMDGEVAYFLATGRAKIQFIEIR